MGCIYLVRHAATAWDRDPATDKIAGWSDIGLDAEGKVNAVECADELKRTVGRIQEIRSSDLERACETAQTIAPALGLKRTDVLKSKDWRPWNLGQFQGEPSENVYPKVQKQYVNSSTKVVPGGECFLAFFDRYTQALQSLMEEVTRDGGDVLVVTHSQNIALARSWIEAGCPSDPAEVKFYLLSANDDPTGVFKIEQRADKWRMEDV